MIGHASSERQAWFLGLVSCPPRLGFNQYGELRSALDRTLNSWSAWRINPTCERTPITTFLHSRAPKGARCRGMRDGTDNAISGRDVRGPRRAALARSLGPTRASPPPSARIAKAGAFGLSPA